MLALLELFEAGEDEALVGGAAAETEAGDGEITFHVGAFGDDRAGPVHDLGSVFERDPWGRLYHYEEIAVVFLRNKARGHAFEHSVGSAKTGQEDRDHHYLPVGKTLERRLIGRSPAADQPVDAGKECVDMAFTWPQEQRCQGGGKRQSVERRNRDRKC